jgi:YtkA-like
MHLRLSSPRGRGLKRTPPVCLLLLGLAAGLIPSGCRPPAEDAGEIALDWTVEPAPPTTGPATLSLTLIDERQGQPVRGAEVRLEGGMTHPGMQPVFSTAREVEPGRYQAPMRFTMAGDWFILVEATLRDGRTLHRQMDLRGVRARQEK